MLFKNLQIYQIDDPSAIPAPRGLDEMLHNQASREPSQLEAVTLGFTAPYSGRPDYFVKTIPQIIGAPILLLAAKRIEKVIPASTVKALAEKEIARFEEEQNRKLGKKERQRIKDEVLFSLLPNALTKATTTYAYIDLNNQLLVVDSASAKRTDDFCSLLRKAIGTLPVVPLYATDSVAISMTNWVLKSDPPAYMDFERTATLESPEGNGKVTVRDLDLESAEVAAHIENGLRVTKLALTYNDEVTFELNEDLQFKKAKLLDVATDRIMAEEPENEDAKITADIMIQADLFNRLVAATMGAFCIDIDDKGAQEGELV